MSVEDDMEFAAEANRRHPREEERYKERTPAKNDHKDLTVGEVNKVRTNKPPVGVPYGGSKRSWALIKNLLRKIAPEQLTEAEKAQLDRAIEILDIKIARIEF